MTNDKITAFTKERGRQTPYICLTAYTAPMAAALAPHVDLLLVGDSLASAIYGYENTLSATMEMMLRHGEAVRRAAPDPIVVVDMPYGSYEHTPQEALTNAKRIMGETGCDAVKLEGGAEMASTIALLTTQGVPVMGHIGLLPQSVEREGGYKIKGKTDNDTDRLLNDALEVARSGAFAMVIEGTIEGSAHLISEKVPVPTIGIGASASCDGQILVCDDMLGFTQGHVPKFVKEYASLRSAVSGAAKAYAGEVRARKFPGEEHLYRVIKKAAS